MSFGPSLIFGSFYLLSIEKTKMPAGLIIYQLLSVTVRSIWIGVPASEQRLPLHIWHHSTLELIRYLQLAVSHVFNMKSSDAPC